MNRHRSANRNALIAGQAGISYGGFIFGQAVRFGFNMAVARMLGEESLGVYALALAVMQIVETFGVAGYDAAAVRYVNIYQAEGRKASDAAGLAIRSALLMSLVPALLVMFFSAPLARLFNGGSASLGSASLGSAPLDVSASLGGSAPLGGGGTLLHFALLSYAVAVPFNVAATVAGHALQGHRDLVPKIVATQLIAPVAMLVLTLLLAFAAVPGPALLVPYTAASVLSCLWIWRQLRLKTGTGIREVLGAPADRRMKAFAFPLLGVSLVSMIAYWLDVLLLGMLGGPVLSGLYQPAARTAGLLRAVLPAFSGIAAPLVAALQAGDESAETGRLYRLVTRWMVLLVTPATVFLMVLPEPVLLLFGPRFSASAPALVLLAAAAFAQAFGGIAGTVLSMAGHGRVTFLNALVALAVQVALSVLLIPLYGTAGAAAASLGAMLLLSALRLLQVSRVLGVSSFSGALWKPAAAGAGTALLLWLCRPWLLGLGPAVSSVSGIAICTAAYFGLTLLFRLEAEDRELILGKH
ncbi:MAG: polysaccharide biosynthesis C-terminal domain-containing protein [Chlorobium sp.]|uniref:oligosaccharide flippase family protein n=1 Tax=Chlorobium sp. TaxID=1095 RepID=UPI0025B91F95|nr:polysaccharide biosynthesis C-terminal domain-containing protein [Chlorobium sp.]MCF8383296.1 polysaccharide biosynthesis C-terminal domain-containing protein [Chlorobium sp.]